MDIEVIISASNIAKAMVIVVADVLENVVGVVEVGVITDLTEIMDSMEDLMVGLVEDVVEDVVLDVLNLVHGDVYVHAHVNMIYYPKNYPNWII